MTTISYALFSLMLAGFASCQEMRTVKVTVTEEDGTPLEGVNTIVTFLGYKGDQTERVKGLTDRQGVFSAQGRPVLRMSVRMEKEGYYRTDSGRFSRKQDHDVTFVLRKIKNPIPLYAKRIHLQFPKNKEWIGYDLKEGDWVAPHGKGAVSDMLLRCDTEMISEMNAKGSFEISFKEDEGIVSQRKNYRASSQMKMPHIAPENGYNNNLLRKEDSYHDKGNEKDIGYFLRTRVVKKGDKIASAHYGKIQSDFGFDPRGNRLYAKDATLKSYATLSFTYYFNSTPNDKNLEFDPQRNLFQDLDPTEQVREP